MKIEPRRDAETVVKHRNAVAAADGTTGPTASTAGWLINIASHDKARVYVTTTGSPTGCTLHGYLRSGGTAGVVGSVSPIQTLNGTPNYDLCFDVQVDSDDLFIYVETLSGGASPTVTVWVSYR